MVIIFDLAKQIALKMMLATISLSHILVAGGKAIVKVADHPIGSIAKKDSVV